MKYLKFCSDCIFPVNIYSVVDITTTTAPTIITASPFTVYTIAQQTLSSITKKLGYIKTSEETNFNTWYASNPQKIEIISLNNLIILFSTYQQLIFPEHTIITPEQLQTYLTERDV